MEAGKASVPPRVKRKIVFNTQKAIEMILEDDSDEVDSYVPSEESSGDLYNFY